MTDAELFPQSNLTPEEKIRENQRMAAIDDDMRHKAKRQLSEASLNTPEGRELKAQLTDEIEKSATNSAMMLRVDLDPDYDIATIIPVPQMVMKPSRLPFIRKQVAVFETVDLAAWQLNVMSDDIGIPYLGRDGILYGLHQKEGIKKIGLADLHTDDLELLQTGLSDLVRKQEITKKLSS